jgi:hypothetical protein
MIDWLVNASARFVGGLSRTLRVVQTGVVQNYAVIFLAGVLAVVGWLIAK